MAYPDPVTKTWTCTKCGEVNTTSPRFAKSAVRGFYYDYGTRETLLHTCKTCGYELEELCLDQRKEK